jgi:hypothetical protein
VGLVPRRLSPDDPFHCDTYDCALATKFCLARQRARWPGGNRTSSGAVVEKRAGIHPFCSSGRCAQGVELARQVDYDPTASWSKRRFKFFAPGVPLARQRMKLARLSEPPTPAHQLDEADELDLVAPPESIERVLG